MSSIGVSLLTCIHVEIMFVVVGPTGTSYQRKGGLDEFGSEPFNPSRIGTYVEPRVENIYV